ncbi:hypothetical protein KP509_03G099200 [Ceratopteris richardii]|nr:hypothetical protein KP509_03G099200 [Ceratopteris richardii]
MYKAREMVDYHMIKNRLDGLQVILDPKLEYETRKKLHEGLVEFYKKRQEAFDEIDAKHEESLKELESGDKKEALPTAEGNDAKSVPMDDQSSDEESLQVDGKVTEGVSSSEVKPDVEFDTEKIVVEAVSAEKESHEKEDNAEMRDLSGVTTAVDEIMRDVLSTPEITTLDLRKADAETKNDAESEGKEESLELNNETSEDDGINVFDYDKWVAYKEQEMAKRYAAEEERKHATLRWKIQLVLGPGDVVHPANRKASVSVYVRELCLSKYAKKRLLALVGRRYNAPKDELTIVSERYPHRYENQKDVLRLLLALIEEARKADELVYNARVAFLESRHTDLKEAVAAA